MRAISSSRQRGTQVLELALVLPLLAFVALAISEGAGFVRAHQVLNNAAREGVRVATLPQNSPTTGDHTPVINDVVRNYSWCNNVNLGTPATMTCSGGTAPSVRCQSPVIEIDQGQVIPTSSGVNIGASQVRVSCGYQMQYLSALAMFGAPKVVQLTARAEFRNLY